MTAAVQFPPLTCKACGGTGIWDAGTEDEGPCRADYCDKGVVLCASCSDHSNSDEPAVGEYFRFNDFTKRDDVIPLCRMHLKRAHDSDAAECRGDYERDMRKDGGA